MSKSKAPALVRHVAGKADPNLVTFLRGFYSYSQLCIKLDEYEAGLSPGMSPAEREGRITAIREILGK